MMGASQVQKEGGKGGYNEGLLGGVGWGGVGWGGVGWGGVGWGGVGWGGVGWLTGRRWEGKKEE